MRKASSPAEAPPLSVHMPSGAARGCSEQDLPLCFSSLQEQHDFRSWWAFACSRGPGEVITVYDTQKKKLISGKYREQYGLAVVSLTPAVFNPVSYSLPPNHQQLPLGNFHRNDNSLTTIIFYNQTRREELKLLVYLLWTPFCSHTMFSVWSLHLLTIDGGIYRQSLYNQ